MACDYCFYSDVSSHRAEPDCGVMSEETLGTLLRRAFAFASGELTLIFQGGEPTLAGPGFYEKLLRLEAQLCPDGLQVRHSLQTNGLRLEPRLLDILERGKFLVGVSCDGSEAIHNAHRRDRAGRGTWWAVNSTLAALAGRGVDCNVLCVVTARSAAKPRELFDSLSGYGFLQFIPCMEPLDAPAGAGPSPEDWGRFLCETFDLYYSAWLKGRPVSVRFFDNLTAMLMGAPPENCAMCGQCQPSYVIEADGSVYPCDFYCTDEYCMGNICAQGFFSLAKSPVAASFRAASRRVPEACRSCRWYLLCRNGCRRERERCPNGEYGLWRWCGSMRIFLPYAEKRMRRMASGLLRRQHEAP